MKPHSLPPHGVPVPFGREECAGVGESFPFTRVLAQPANDLFHLGTIVLQGFTKRNLPSVQCTPCVLLIAGGVRSIASSARLSGLPHGLKIRILILHWQVGRRLIGRRDRDASRCTRSRVRNGEHAIIRIIG